MHIDFITAVALILAILLFGYLALTLLFPEKF
jgi:K+-transporting ATPase KdpF subunit